jgi:uncharacterized protein YqjF (DUF2071 family)
MSPFPDRLTYERYLVDRPTPSGIDVVTELTHFAIVTYAVAPEAVQRLIHPRFAPDTVMVDGRPMALLSVVPFLDHDFCFAQFPLPRFHFGQTNYRIYVIDTLTGERAVWFLGTVLDSWSVAVPRILWRLPWHYGRIRFDCELVDGHYRRYEMTTRSAWAASSLSLQEDTAGVFDFPGFPDEETALVVLTHPLTGYFLRRDGRLGTYRVWHDRLRMRPGRCLAARFDLLHTLGLVCREDQNRPHSVMLQPVTEFTIYLPPKAIHEQAL